MISKELISILICPVCRQDIELRDNRIYCKGCGRRYPIRNGIPVMLIEAAEEKC